MDPESKNLLEETYELEKENNKMLHKIRRAQRYATIMRVAYWFVILGLSVGAFYFIQPYIDEIMSLTGKANSSLNELKNFLPK